MGDDLFDANKRTNRQAKVIVVFRNFSNDPTKKKKLDPGSRQIWRAPGSDQRHASAPYMSRDTSVPYFILLIGLRAGCRRNPHSSHWTPEKPQTRPPITQSLIHSPAEDGWFLHQDMEIVLAAHLAVSVVHRAFKASGSFPGHLQHRSWERLKAAPFGCWMLISHTDILNYTHHSLYQPNTSHLNHTLYNPWQPPRPSIDGTNWLVDFSQSYEKCVVRRFRRCADVIECKDIQIPSKHNKIYYTLPRLDYMFRLLTVIIRPSSELIQNHSFGTP